VKVGNTLKKMLWVVSMMSLIVCVSLFGLSSFSNYNFLPDTDKKLAEKPDQTVDSIKPSAPDSNPVLVNKQKTLPEDFEPMDLIDPSIPFIFNEKTEKRKMSAEAAGAIETLFAAAKKQGVELLGVSAYRSHETQTALFNHYVEKDGYEKALTYSAPPGTSEHETGLAIDVTGGDGKCAAEECFAGTIEAKWLEENAAQFGFIIRYPKGKEAITGYQYEPWHLRYVGTEIAKNITNRGITLEEYYNAIPVNN
jgi:zinc D-Ala-D-Ala carboxypeptidase